MSEDEFLAKFPRFKRAMEASTPQAQPNAKVCYACEGCGDTHTCTYPGDNRAGVSENFPKAEAADKIKEITGIKSDWHFMESNILRGMKWAWSLAMERSGSK